MAKFMCLFQKDPVVWGHCLITKDNDKLWEAKWLLIEVDAKTRLEKLKDYKILRLNCLTYENKQTILQEAPKLLGRHYGFQRIFLQIFDHIFNINWFTSQEEREYVQVCSSYAGWIYDKACGYKFNGVDWESCDPDDIEDDSLLYPERWIVVEEKGSEKAMGRRLLKRG